MKIVNERGEVLEDPAIFGTTLPRLGNDLKIHGTRYRIIEFRNRDNDKPTEVVVRAFNICAVCGEQEADHHHFVPLLPPIGCICDPRDWGDPSHIPAVCSEYIHDPEYDTCKTCQHEKDCHAIP